jgi:hypothetical protein
MPGIVVGSSTSLGHRADAAALMKPHYCRLAQAVAVIVISAGCAAASHRVTAAARFPPPPLATSSATASGTWAVVAMGGPAAAHNSFWQLFTRGTGSSVWRLATPPGVADNGGLVVASGGGQSLVAGVRPSQGLTFSPLAATSDDGRSWQAGPPLRAALANGPDVLAATRGGRNLLALSARGTAQLASAGGPWSILAGPRALIASPPTRSCGVLRLTAVSYTPGGAPLLGGTCRRRGTAGIFAATGRTWRTAGPKLPRSLAASTIHVLRLTSYGSANLALLAAGSGRDAALLAASTSDGGAHWTVSPPVSADGARVRSSGFGAAGWVWLILDNGRAETLDIAAAAWHALPALPAGTAVLAAGPGGHLDALATHGAKLTIWRLDPHPSSWHAAQVINVPIQYGSSG